MKNLSHIENKIQQLPPFMIEEVEDFLDFLLTKAKGQRKGKLKQDWAGELKEFSEKYTSLELQKKALEWMSN
ncbi:DUF2281 domain-containing protein [candidate division KSB1 bacterium]|nr:DUF2281 domain-containing protein [candidate division KSB1 bacterium]